MAEEPISVQQLTASYDYGQFSLVGDILGHRDTQSLVDAAIAGPGVAGDGQVLVVISPHQQNAETVVRIERWDREPPDDRDAWDEVVIGSLSVEQDRVLWRNPVGTDAEIAVPADDYQVRIAGRGFVARGWPGSITPGDTWRVQLWAAPPDLPAGRLKAWDGLNDAAPRGDR